MMRIPLAASDLARNSRVVLDPDELPYLVDSVTDRFDDVLGFLVDVTYSNGDTAVYYATETLTVETD